MIDRVVSLLAGTLFLRPYVAAFFIVYLLGCSLHLGMKRALLFGLIGYGIAWLSELSSIHTGIPYGDYFYIETTRGQELWVLGVPLMDSASYVFLAYASYSMALLVTAPVILVRKLPYLLETRALRSGLSVRLLGALFFVYLDIIIDPVALQGSRWFLGQIYGYPEQGVYFGVPISNFIGWFIVGFLMICALQRIDAFLYRRNAPDCAGYAYPWRYLIGPALYGSVLLFNLAVTFAIEDYTLGWVGIFIILMPAVLLVRLVRMKYLHGANDEALKAHLRDFPEAAVPGSQ